MVVCLVVRGVTGMNGVDRTILCGLSHMLNSSAECCVGPCVLVLLMSLVQTAFLSEAVWQQNAQSHLCQHLDCLCCSVLHERECC